MNVFSTRMQHCPVNCQHSLVGVGVIRIYVYRVSQTKWYLVGKWP